MERDLFIIQSHLIDASLITDVTEVVEETGGGEFCIHIAGRNP